MPRAPRDDAPDTWHHVFNRAVARRPLFETRTDVRRLLCLVARSVRRGEIEVHAYCVLTTHFHLLVRSPVGALSDGLQRIEDGYARWFNRGRRRDGALFRGRFRSVRVRSEAHWTACVAYIDRNPIDAHLVPIASLYPWSSARDYARRRGPPWLTRERVEALVMGRLGLAGFDPSRYDEAVAASASPSVVEWVERTLRRRPRSPLAFDDLLGSAPAEVAAWMRRKALLADGAADRCILASIADVLRALERELHSGDDRPIQVGRARRSARQALRVGLLRDVAGATLAQIAAMEGIGESTVRRRGRWHRVALLRDSAYAATAARVAAAALARRDESGGTGSGTVPPLSGPPTSRGR